MNFINRNEIANGVYFTNIKDSRFKTMKISVNIVVPLSVETASENALVGGLLVRSCKKYPDFTVLSGNGGVSASDKIRREVAIPISPVVRFSFTARGRFSLNPDMAKSPKLRHTGNQDYW